MNLSRNQAKAAGMYYDETGAAVKKTNKTKDEQGMREAKILFDIVSSNRVRKISAGGE